MEEFLESPVRTEDPSEASLFYIPAFLYSYSGGWEAGGHAGGRSGGGGGGRCVCWAQHGGVPCVCVCCCQCPGSACLAAFRPIPFAI